MRMTGDSGQSSPPELGVFSVKAGLRSPPHSQPRDTLQCLGQISMEMPQQAGPVSTGKIDLRTEAGRGQAGLERTEEEGLTIYIKRLPPLSLTAVSYWRGTT